MNTFCRVLGVVAKTCTARAAVASTRGSCSRPSVDTPTVVISAESVFTRSVPAWPRVRAPIRTIRGGRQFGNPKNVRRGDGSDTAVLATEESTAAYAMRCIQPGENCV
jgi:hypothetical protein